MVKDTSRISVDHLLSHHISGALYVASCVLVIQWRLTGDNDFKADADLFTLLFDRLNEVHESIGLKCKLALAFDMKRDVDSIRRLREKGFKGLLSDCSKWTDVLNAAGAQGIIRS